MEEIPKAESNQQEQEHLAPFERQEGKRIEEIDAQEQLEKIINFSDDIPGKDKKRTQDLIMAARNYLDWLKNSDPDSAKDLELLINKAQDKFHKENLLKIRPIKTLDQKKEK
ncbi:MAG: hypothetical protein AB1643_00015 [Patescibacteria group bacterium]